jgi:hypothetical protein
MLPIASETRQGLATDPIEYFAASENRDLGIVKSISKPFKKLIIDPSSPTEWAGKKGHYFLSHLLTPD